MIEKLGSYSRSLTAHVKVEMEKGGGAVSAGETEEREAETVGRQTVTRATISVLKELKSFVNDHPAIMIAINGRTSAGERNYRLH